jgi:cytochrome c
VQKDAAVKAGPNLHGILGRKAASDAKFNYSPALRQSGIVWTEESLDAFLSAPTKTVPGTRMVMAVSDPAQRKAIIDYLGRAN